MEKKKQAMFKISLSEGEFSIYCPLCGGWMHAYHLGDTEPETTSCLECRIDVTFSFDPETKTLTMKVCDDGWEDIERVAKDHGLPPCTARRRIEKELCIKCGGRLRLTFEKTDAGLVGTCNDCHVKAKEGTNE